MRFWKTHYAILCIFFWGLFPVNRLSIWSESNSSLSRCGIKWEHLFRSPPTFSFCFSRAYSPDILIPEFASFVHWLYNTTWWFLYFFAHRVLTRVQYAEDCAQGVYGSICREYRACDLFDKIKVCLDITQEFINNEKCN